MDVHGAMTGEELLEQGLIEAIREMDLEHMAEEAGTEPLTDRDGETVDVDDVDALAARGFLTNDKGVWVRLSDGSEYQISIVAYRAPRS